MRARLVGALGASLALHLLFLLGGRGPGVRPTPQTPIELEVLVVAGPAPGDPGAPAGPAPGPAPRPPRQDRATPSGEGGRPSPRPVAETIPERAPLADAGIDGSGAEAESPAAEGPPGGGAQEATSGGGARGGGGGEGIGEGEGEGAAGRAETMLRAALQAHLRARSDRCYPAAARRRGIEGEARLSFCVDEAGAPGRIRLVRSSGSSLLDDAAEACVIRAAAPLPGPPGCVELSVPFRLR